MKTEIEKRASKFIDETDMMQFSTMEIMVMFAEKELEAINYSQCCTELPNKMIIELSDEEMQIVSTDKLIQMEKEAMEFDGFEGWIVKGKAAILK